jgi:hypothetical protein
MSARIRLRYLAVALFAATAVAATLALDHMDSLPALLLIAPGYLMQAWLFETGRALGGLGYQVTVAGVSALVWTVIVLSGVASVRYIVHRLPRRSAAP